jgi:SsrA-binding protein
MTSKRARASQPESNGRSGGDRLITSNRRAFHEYFVIDTIEAGIVLSGTEIKSIREGKVTISEAYARIENGELWLIGCHISPYSHGNRANHDPDRPKKLLVHKRQLRELRVSVEQKGMTLVPLRLALRNGRAKVDIGVVRGKKLYDKRDAAADRQSRRDIDRALRERG